MKTLLTILILCLCFTNMTSAQNVSIVHHGPHGNRIEQECNTWDNLNNITVSVTDGIPNGKYNLAFRVAESYTYDRDGYNIWRPTARWTDWFRYARYTKTGDIVFNLVLDENGCATTTFPNTGLYSGRNIVRRGVFYRAPIYRRLGMYPIEIKLSRQNTEQVVFGWIIVK